MIIWTGWGAAIAILGIAIAGIVSGLCRDLVPTDLATAVGLVIGGALGALAMHFIIGRIEGAPGRTLVDPANGQTVVLRKTAGSLFFIPARYWVFIVPAICVLGAIGAFMGPAPGA